MLRVATYACPCCQGRTTEILQPRRRAPLVRECRGWCRRCGGACAGKTTRVAVDSIQEPPSAPPLLRRPETQSLSLRRQGLF